MKEEKLAIYVAPLTPRFDEENLRNKANASLKVSVAFCSYLSSYKLTRVKVAVPVRIVSTQKELNAEVGFLARNEKM